MKESGRWSAASAALLAVAAPVLIAYNLPPSATFLNQAAAYIGWGLYLLVLCAALPAGLWPRSWGAAAAAMALTLLVGAAVASPVWASLPWALAWPHIGTLLAAMLVLCVGATIARAGHGRAAFRSFCIALLLAGCLSGAIGLIQVYAPEWTNGTWVSHSTLVGRAVGNMRQPNHLSSLLLWSIVAAVWLGECSRSARRGVAFGSPGSDQGVVSPPPRWATAIALGLALFFLFVIVLSASRTGAVGTLTLAVWGLLDRRLSRRVRVALLLAPLAYAALWSGAAAWAQYTGSTFVGEVRFTSRENISSSRFAIWSNTLELIRAHPWHGVGFGEYNFAWTLTPFPGRPTEFFDHAHNLPLHLAAELGVPLAALVIGLFVAALLCATRRAIESGRETPAVGGGRKPAPPAADVTSDAAAMAAPGASGFAGAFGANTAGVDPSGVSHPAVIPIAGSAPAVEADAALSTSPGSGVSDDPLGSRASASAFPGMPVERAALVIVLLVCVHSLLEYPLWYSYFLLPTMFALGLCLGPGRELRASRSAGPASPTPARRKERTRPLVVASMLLTLGGVLAVYDYARVVVIFAPPAGAPPLADRIEAGRHSVLFAYHADYALATTARQPSTVAAAFARASHYLLDARLMMSWAIALAESGQTDRARHVAARLREFGNPQAEAFFAVCNEAAEVSDEVPFQCEAPKKQYGFADFR